MLAGDSAYAAKAARVSALAKDVSEYLADIGLPFGFRPPPPISSWPIIPACSMQHGQKIKEQPKTLLRQAASPSGTFPRGTSVAARRVPTNIMQPEIATRLRDRKLSNIAKVSPDVIATGNIGCMTQLGTAAGAPVVSTPWNCWIGLTAAPPRRDHVSVMTGSANTKRLDSPRFRRE